MNDNVKILVAEAFGTAVLVIGGTGTAILAGPQMGALGVSLAFGLSLLVMGYAIGSVSGCHINPAVTVGMLVAGKIKSDRLWWYIGGQFGGGVLGAFVIFAIANGSISNTPSGNFTLKGLSFAANGFGDHGSDGAIFASLSAVIIAEVALTAIFVIVVITTTRESVPAGFGAIGTGLSLTLVHLISIPVDNTSVNPARSFAVAVFKLDWALSELWVFLLFPTIGGILAGLAYNAMYGAKESPATSNQN